MYYAASTLFRRDETRYPALIKSIKTKFRITLIT